MIRIGVFFVVLNILVGCGSTKVTDNHPEKIEVFKKFVDARYFEFNANSAYPLQTQAFNSVANSGILPPGSNSGRIDLIGNPSFIKVFGDSVSVILPYFGERRMSGGYGANTDIKFEGIPEQFNMRYDTVKEKYNLQFDIVQNTETYDINLDIFKNRQASLNINSNQRSTIQYDGVVQELQDYKEEN
ncbi:MAG: DUF4251 domain-containing protein [Maribacter sp.]